MFVRWMHFFSTPANGSQCGKSKWHYTRDGVMTLCGLRIPSLGRPTYFVQVNDIPGDGRFCRNCRRCDPWLIKYRAR